MKERNRKRRIAQFWKGTDKDTAESLLMNILATEIISERVMRRLADVQYLLQRMRAPEEGAK